MSGDEAHSDRGALEGRRPGHLWTSLAGLLREIGPAALAGLAGALVLLALFAKLSEEVFTREIVSLDNGIALWVHGFAGPTMDAVANALSTIGGAVGIPLLTILAFALLVWRGKHSEAWRVLLAVIGGVVLSQALKFLFHRSRPDLWPGGQFAGFSFPSGHATLSLCLFGMFAWLGWRYFNSPVVRTLWTIAMVLLIALVGLSRIYLGAHYPSDVLAGYIAGGFWLASLLVGTDIYNRVRGKEPPPRPA